MQMTKNHSGWVNNFFAAGTSDWTPASAHPAAHILFMPVSHDPEASKRCASVLSQNELQRADRFIKQDSKVHFKLRRAFRRYCGALALGSQQPLSQINFNETDKGRPYLPDSQDLCFSFSSCHLGFLGAWSQTHAIGIDIEDQTRDLEAVELAQRFFSKTEAKAVEETHGEARLLAFFKLWSLKEAALKSIGEGLPFGLAAFEFELAPNLRIIHVPHGHGGRERFKAHMIEKTGSCVALVIREKFMT